MEKSYLPCGNPSEGFFSVSVQDAAFDSGHFICGFGLILFNLNKKIQD
jgi:hypothetical protein